MTGLLVVTAVAAEREAIERGLPHSDRSVPRSAGPRFDRSVWGGVTVLDVGVGMAAAAAGTARALHDTAYAGVICAGIGGGFDLAAGTLTVATRSIAADLGAQSPDGFLSLDELGFGSSTVECDATLGAQLTARLPQAVRGGILTVATVTGTAERAGWLRERHPDAVAEAMEGFGVATAAAQAGRPFAEVRAVSNAVGPRDRAAWRIPDALAALTALGTVLVTLVG